MGLLSAALNCTPSEAYKEWRRWPAGFLDEIVEAREFSRVYRAVTSASSKAARQRATASELGALAAEIEIELVQEKRGR